MGTTTEERVMTHLEEHLAAGTLTAELVVAAMARGLGLDARGNALRARYGVSERAVDLEATRRHPSYDWSWNAWAQAALAGVEVSKRAGHSLDEALLSPSGVVLDWFFEHLDPIEDQHAATAHVVRSEQSRTSLVLVGEVGSLSARLKPLELEAHTGLKLQRAVALEALSASEAYLHDGVLALVVPVGLGEGLSNWLGSTLFLVEDPCRASQVVETALVLLTGGEWRSTSLSSWKAACAAAVALDG